jgi:hypothetical protein
MGAPSADFHRNATPGSGGMNAAGGICPAPQPVVNLQPVADMPAFLIHFGLPRRLRRHIAGNEIPNSPQRNRLLAAWKICFFNPAE